MGTRAGVALDRQNCGPTSRRTSFVAHAHLSGNIVSEGCVERFAVFVKSCPSWRARDKQRRPCDC
jgi:hypothetical protein